jgi:O-antigen/teichoic acid export membrane protein
VRPPRRGRRSGAPDGEAGDAGGGGLRRSLAAAIADSGFSSLATFAVGLFAAHRLPLDQLGGYGILFVAAFALGSTASNQLYFTPVEIAYVDRSAGDQLDAVKRSVGVGLLFTVPIGLLVTAVGMLVIPELPWSDRLTIGVGAMGVAVLSPTQDHVRRILHQASRSPRAMQVSAVQLVVAVAALATMVGLHVDPLFIPFSALALANAVSLCAGLLFARLDGGGGTSRPPPARSLLRLGYLLLVSTGSEQLGAFIGVALLGAISGATAVGQYEAARQLSQPMYVLSTGLQSVIRPRVMRAARHADRAAAKRDTGIYAATLGVCGIGYAFVAGIDWPGNPIARVFPNAFTQTGLLPALILAATVTFMIPLLAYQAISTGHARELVRLSLTNQVFYLGSIALLAPHFGALAVPIGTLLYATTWCARFRPVLSRIYAPGPSKALVAAGPASR